MKNDDFCELYRSKKPDELLSLLMDEMSMIADASVQAALARYCLRNEESAKYYDMAISAHRERANWLCENVASALVAADIGVS